ncbi:nSTAND1 domain-containing NTPase [Sorangium sp. So ce388]|uniref:nSTAND1 domain-containing NTPase n=1 Tax=Sorangium sp. So ce388 TaxID=3133309 RepID=UPI003F5C66B8
MPAASDGVDNAPLSPHEIVLELLRATDTSNPFAFELQEQWYVRRLDTGAGRSASFPWGDKVLDNLTAIQQESTTSVAAAWLAEELRAFLDRLGWSREEENIREALDVGRPVHITLRLGAAELYTLPWEFVPLGASGRPLGSLPGVLLRYEWPDTQTARPEPYPPPEGGRIVFAWSAAGGAVPAAEHLAAIRKASAEGHHRDFDPGRDVLPHASLRGLREALRIAPTAVLHLLCHGGSLDQEGTAYGLVLDSDNGAGKELVDARELQLALAEHMGSLRLVVLCACHGGNPGALDSRLGSVAQALHRAGIPAIVGSRYPLSVDASITLAEQLYQGLLVKVQSLSATFIEARARLRECAARAAWASLQLYARAADGQDYRPIVHRPYRGLLAFQAEHARYFFGRDAEVQEALGRLSALLRANDAARPRFLICTGASGAGKSSLVLAGVLPALRKRDGVWAAAFIRPHSGWRAALQMLASRPNPGVPLLLIVDQFEEVFTMIADRGEREAFVQALWFLAGHPASGVSVIVTLRVDYLARCGEIELGTGDRFLEDVAYDEAHRVFVRRMKADHLRKTIEQPLHRVGLVLEEGLVEQMLKDAGDEPGALPLLQYTLDQMWQHRRGRQLTWEQYNALGGVGGALEKQANGILQRFDGVRQRAARRMIVQLVALDDDARLDRRRRVRLDKLRRGSPEEAAVFLDVLDAFVRERLLVLSEGGGESSAPDGDGEHAAPDAQPHGRGIVMSPNVEVAHEQLIRSWSTLRSWMQEDRQMLADLELLDRWVEEAREFSRYVLDRDRLVHALDLRDRHPSDISDAARALIQKSELAAKARRFAAVGMTVAAVAAAVVMGVLGVWALRKEHAAREAEKVARHQSARARSAQLLEDARALLERNQPGPASKLLLEVREPESSRGWTELAQKILEAGIPKITFRGHRGGVLSAAFSPDGQRIVTASRDGTARVWNADGLGDAVELDAEDGTELISAVFTPDGKHIRTIARDGTTRQWDAGGNGPSVVLGEARVSSIDLGLGFESISVAPVSSDGGRVVTFSGETAQIERVSGSGKPIRLHGHSGPISSAAFSPDNQYVVTTSLDKTARLWSAGSPSAPVVLHPVHGHSNAVTSAEFSPDGRHVVTTSFDHTARIWAVERTGRLLAEPIVLRGHTAPVLSATFSPDSKRVATTSYDRTVRVWSVSDPDEPLVLRGHENAVVSVAFSPDGKSLVTASSDGTACLWSADRAGVSVTLRGFPLPTLTRSFSPDGTRILLTTRPSGGAKHSPLTDAATWNLDGSDGPTNTPARARLDDSSDRTVVASEHKDGDNHGVFSFDGRRLITACNGTDVCVWNADGSDAPIILRGPARQGQILTAEFSPDGSHVVTASADGNVRVWNTDGSGSPDVLGSRAGQSNHKCQARSAAFSPDGTSVIGACDDGVAHIWSINGSRDEVALRDKDDKYESAQLRAAVFSPDGGRVLLVHERAKHDTLIRKNSHADEDNHLFAALQPGNNSTPSLVIVRTDKPPSIDVEGLWTSGPRETARVWNAGGSGDPLVLYGHRADRSPRAFSPDGSRIATTYRNAIYIHRIDEPEEPLVLRSDNTEVDRAVFSPDGRYILAEPLGGGKVTVWRADGSGGPMVLRDDTSEIDIRSVAFSPDSTRVAASLGKGDIVQIWVVSTDILKRRLLDATRDCLSPLMRHMYLGETEADAQTNHDACARAQNTTGSSSTGPAPQNSQAPRLGSEPVAAVASKMPESFAMYALPSPQAARASASATPTSIPIPPLASASGAKVKQPPAPPPTLAPVPTPAPPRTNEKEQGTTAREHVNGPKSVDRKISAPSSAPRKLVIHREGK